MNKHTPGPWDWQDGRLIGDLNGDGPDVLAIEETGGDYGASHIQTSDADACLIAAAPDMLEAMRDALSASDANDGDSLMNAIAAFRPILARIEGNPQ